MGQKTLLILQKQSSELDKSLAALPKQADILAVGQDKTSISGTQGCASAAKQLLPCGHLTITGAPAQEYLMSSYRLSRAF